MAKETSRNYVILFGPINGEDRTTYKNYVRELIGQQINLNHVGAGQWEDDTLMIPVTIDTRGPHKIRKLFRYDERTAYIQVLRDQNYPKQKNINGYPNPQR